MRWDDIVVAIPSVAAADPVLASIYGEQIRAAGTAAWQVPSLEYQLIIDTLQPEIWVPHLVQWDQWVQTHAQLVASERALRNLFDQNFPVWLGGVYMWTVFTEGADLVDNPDRWNFRGRTIRFRYTPIMEEYVVPAGS